MSMGCVNRMYKFILVVLLFGTVIINQTYGTHKITAYLNHDGNPLDRYSDEEGLSDDDSGYTNILVVNEDNSHNFIDSEYGISIETICMKQEKNDLSIQVNSGDLVLTETDGLKYPIFKNNRCLISKIKDGISYFGYIDKTGNTVIEPKFLNAINFNNNKAIALGILKEELGSNDILGKNVVSYRYFEVIIDTDGNVDTYLNPKGINVVLDKDYLKTPPEITSKQISNNLFVVRTKNSKWMIKSIE